MADFEVDGPPSGLEEFIFHHNSLSTRFMEAFSELIPYDIYIRKIDLSHNKFTEEMILGPLIEAMGYN